MTVMLVKTCTMNWMLESWEENGLEVEMALQWMASRLAQIQAELVG
jgi:hypothetical protein